MNKTRPFSMLDEYFYDYKGENPIKGKVIKYFVEGDNFAVAWWIVAVYIMQMQLTPFHYKLMKHQLKGNRTLVMAGRGFGKSYTNTTSYVLTRALNDRNIRIAIAARTHTQSKEFVREIKQLLESDVIVGIFGNLKGNPWTEQDVTLKRDVTHKEPTIKAGCIETDSAFIGNHFDIIVIDDAVGEINSMTKNRRQKLVDLYSSSIAPTIEQNEQNDEEEGEENADENIVMKNGVKLKKYGMIHAIGTHYHEDDFWNHLEQSGAFDVLKLKSLYKDKNGNYVSICPERKNVKHLLEERRQLGTMTFNKQYQQITPDSKGSIFMHNWVKIFNRVTIDNDRVFVDYINEEDEKNREEVLVYGAADLAISLGESNDYFVVAIVGKGIESGKIFLLDLYRGRITFNMQLNKIFEMFKKWNMMVYFGIESVAYQDSLFQEVKRLSSYPVGPIKAVRNKLTRMISFSAIWERGDVYIYSHCPFKDELINETLNFPNDEHDDIIDAFELAVQASSFVKDEYIESMDLNILGL